MLSQIYCVNLKIVAALRFCCGLRRRLNIDGLAKMPLQASIFASWYNVVADLLRKSAMVPLLLLYRRFRGVNMFLSLT